MEYFYVDLNTEPALHIEHTQPGFSKPSMCAIAFSAKWPDWITLECGNPHCRGQWHSPAHPKTGEPDTATWSKQILTCPHCHTQTTVFPSARTPYEI